MWTNLPRLAFLGLNELGDVVKIEFDVVGLVTLISGLVSGHLRKTCLLLDAGLGHVFTEDFEELGLYMTEGRVKYLITLQNWE